MNKYISFFIICSLLSVVSCSKSTIKQPEDSVASNNKVKQDKKSKYLLPNIDLSHWKVTLPIGKPTEVDPPEILNYATNEVLKPFMYNDSTDGSIVFYAYPGTATANATSSRTELREQMAPGNNNVNWTFEQGGRMKGTLRMAEVTKSSDGKYHRSIIMQIHGRLTNKQRDFIGQKDNNAAPILKIYWAYGRVRVARKILKDVNATDEEILHEEAWTDEAVYLGKNVDFNKFTLEVKVSKGRLEVILNDNESVVFSDINMERWGIFENYFKAGNYFQTKDAGAFAKVKYYDLEVSH